MRHNRREIIVGCGFVQKIFINGAKTASKHNFFQVLSPFGTSDKIRDNTAMSVSFKTLLPTFKNLTNSENIFNLGQIQSDIIPATDATYHIGNSTNRFLSVTAGSGIFNTISLSTLNVTLAN